MPNPSTSIERRRLLVAAAALLLSRHAAAAAILAELRPTPRRRTGRPDLGAFA